MNKISGIYCIRNITTGKKYIGQSIDIHKEWKSSHLPALKYNRHHNKYLQRAWNKYGESNFEHFIVYNCDENKLNEYEEYYIKYLKSHYTENGYNMSFGGETVMKGRNHTRETKIKMSISKKNMSYETKEKIGKAVIGRKKDNASSKYHGVMKRIANKNKNIYWRACIKINKKVINIGNFKQEVEAAIAYDKYIIENRLLRPLNFV